MVSNNYSSSSVKKLAMENLYFNCDKFTFNSGYAPHPGQKNVIAIFAGRKAVTSGAAYWVLYLVRSCRILWFSDVLRYL